MAAGVGPQGGARSRSAGRVKGSCAVAAWCLAMALVNVSPAMPAGALAGTGLLRVVTSPPVPSQITVDGGVADSWGLQWVKELTGSHSVCFSALAGYTTPACQTISVTSGATTTVTGTFVPRGYLHVVTSPAVAAQIRIDGSPADDWGVYTDLPVGSHQVCFGPVAGFTPPACQTPSVTAGSTTTVTGTYSVSSGTGLSGDGELRVTTSPAVPSQIVLDGTIADTWGLNWLQVPPGSHTVCFTHVQGYGEPGCQTVAVTSGATTTVAGTFVPRGFLAVTTSPPVAATITINGSPADDWGIYTDLPAGQYSVCFGAVPGFTAPACQSPTVGAGTTTVTGTYVATPPRPFTVHVPASYSPSTPAPLLVTLAGYGASGALESSYLGLTTAADAAGMLSVAPDGTKDTMGLQFWNATDACCDFYGSGVDDSSYLSGVISQIEAQYNVDPHRVFIVGDSNGGFMAYRVACDHAGQVAAVVSLEGATFATTGQCHPSQPVATLEIHGTADASVSYTGGTSNGHAYPGATTTAATWATYDGCTSAVDTPAPTPHPVEQGKPAATVIAYSTGCTAGGHAELWTTAGGTHVPNLAPTFASDVVSFLLAHPKPG